MAEKKMIKLLASDFDNTLAYKWKVSENNCKSIDLLEHNGIDFALVTGRPFSNIQHIFRKYGIDGHFVAFNGAITYKNGTGMIQDLPMNKSALPEIIDTCIKNKWIFLFYSIDCCYLYGGLIQRILHIPASYIVKWATGVGLKSFYADRELDSYPDFYKMNIHAPKNELLKLSQKINSEGKLTATQSGTKMIEIMNGGVNKWIGLKALIKDLEIEKEELSAIGDFDNDVEMLREAGQSFVLKNASKAAKESGDIEVGDVREDGFSQACKIIIEGNRL